MLVANQSIETAGGADDDVGVSLLVLQDFSVLLDGGTAVENASLDIRHVFAESVVLVSDLERELASVAHDQDGALAGNGLDLLESGEDEDGGFTETGLGLTDDVAAEHGLRDASLLNCNSRIAG